jgi:hypothetical protein
MNQEDAEGRGRGGQGTRGGGESVGSLSRSETQIKTYRYSWSLPGRPNLEVFLPELEGEEINEVESLFQMILGVQRRRHMRIPSAEEVYGILSKQGTDATPTPDAADGGR